MDLHKVHIVNCNQDIEIEDGTTLLELSKDYSDLFDSPILVASVNHNLCDLNYKICSNSYIEFFNIDSNYGFRTYQSSCMFILVAAIHKLYGDKVSCWVEHSINYNFYCTLNGLDVTEENLYKIKKCMMDIIKKDYEIESCSFPIEDCFEIFKENNLINRLQSLKFVESGIINLYKLKDFYDFFNDKIVPSTSYIKKFDLKKFENGFLLIFASKEDSNKLNDVKKYPKLTTVFNEYEEWSRILKVSALPSLNKLICSGKTKDIIFTAEALHEKKIAEIADKINKQNKKIVLIAGPSSSGKTTFAKRLAIQLIATGKIPQVISLDDYYKNRDDVPEDSNGRKNFENLSSLDIEQFNEDMLNLLKFKPVNTPLYDMATGLRKVESKKIQLEDNSILIVEGIHGINEQLTVDIPKEDKFKIYISALTQLNIDEHNRIATTDNRLIRRLVRDHYFRGFDLRTTINMWPDVLEGERENIFPYQEQADAMFNSALVYELSVLKLMVEPLLFNIDRTDSTYLEARRLLNLLNSFIAIPETDVPNNSILREFIGHSCFY